MRLWDLTLEELVAGRMPIPYPDVDDLPPQAFKDEWIVPISTNIRFATTAAAGSADMQDQVLLERVGDRWEAVGSFIGSTLEINKRARRKGLAIELVLRCMEHRASLDSLGAHISHAGLEVLKKAHREAVLRALRAKLDVPKLVRDDYGL